MNWMDDIYFLVLTISSLVLQSIVVLYGLKMFRLVKWLKDWTPAWLLFTLASFIILLRRILWLIEYIQTCPDKYSLTEAVLTVMVSFLFLGFIFVISHLFAEYLKVQEINGKKE